MKVILRKFGYDKIDHMFDLWKNLAAEENEVSNFPQEPSKKYFNFFKISKIEHISKGDLAIFSAEVNCDKVAFIICSIKNREIDDGEIDNVYVKPEYRGTGIIDILMDKVKKWFDDRDISKISLHVAGGNERVMNFYSRHGFKPHYHIMQKDLENDDWN